MLITIQIEYDKLKKLNKNEFENKKSYWLKRLYEVKK